MHYVSGLLIGSALSLCVGCGGVSEEPDHLVGVTSNAATEAAESAAVGARAEEVRSAAGAPIEAAAARALLEASPLRVEQEAEQDLGSLLDAVHATNDGPTRGRLITLYMRNADRLSAEERVRAVSQLSKSFALRAVPKASIVKAGEAR